MSTYDADGLDLDAAVEGHVDEQLLIVLVAAQPSDAFTGKTGQSIDKVKVMTVG